MDFMRINTVLFLRDSLSRAAHMDLVICNFGTLSSVDFAGKLYVRSYVYMSRCWLHVMYRFGENTRSHPSKFSDIECCGNL